MVTPINELKSFTEYTVSTPTSVFTIGFQYKYNVDHVNVYVDGVEATVAGYTIKHDSQGTLELEPAVPSGIVRLERETNIDSMLHTFSAGAKFSAGNMDEDFKQLRHAQQEMRDEVTRTAEQFAILDANATSALDAANAAVSTANSIDAKATTALANSNTAVSTANSANSTANTALTTANGIDAKATTALSNSSTALTTANTALSTANGIDAKATQAQQDASAAMSTVSTQKGAANGIATLDANAVVPVAQLPTASATALGLIQVATQAEVNTGLNSARAIVPNTLLGGIKTHLNVTGEAPIYACRAWVNFNGTGTVAIIASGNVTSITDNGVGDFTVNFTTAIPDANYAIAGVTGNADVTATPAAASLRAQSGGITTTSCRVRTANHFNNSPLTSHDMPYNSVIIFR